MTDWQGAACFVKEQGRHGFECEQHLSHFYAELKLRTWDEGLSKMTSASMCVIRQKQDRLDFDTLRCVWFCHYLDCYQIVFWLKGGIFKSHTLLVRLLLYVLMDCGPRGRIWRLSSRENEKASFDHGQWRTHYLMLFSVRVCLFIVELQ